MSDKNEATITRDDVRREHVDGVNTVGHWIYLFAVLIGSFLLMVALIAVMGSGGG